MTYIRAHQDSQHLVADDGLVHRAKLVCVSGGKTFCERDYVFPDRDHAVVFDALRLLSQTRAPLTCMRCLVPVRW